MTFSLNNITSFGRNIRSIPTLDVPKYGATDKRTPMTDSESETDSVVQVTSNSSKRALSKLSSPPRPTKKHKDVGHSLTADGGNLTTTNGIHSSTLDSDLSTEIPAVIFDLKSNDASEVDSLLNDASGDSLDASDMVSDFKVLVHRCVDIVQTTGKNATEKKTALAAAVVPAVVAGGVTVIGVTALSVAALASHNADMKRIESSIGNVESSIGKVESSIGKVHEDVALMAPKEDVAKVLQNQGMILKNQTECAQLFGGINVRLTTTAEEITDIKGHLESADKERASMKGVLDKAAEEITDIKGHLESADKERASMKGHLERADKERAIMKEDLKKATEERASMKGILDQAAEERASMKGQLAVAAQERAVMNARLDGIDTQLAAAAQERASMKERLDSIDTQLADAAQERASMKKRLDSIDAHLAAAAQERATAAQERATAAQERAIAAQERALIITMLQEAAARKA